MTIAADDIKARCFTDESELVGVQQSLTFVLRLRPRPRSELSLLCLGAEGAPASVELQMFKVNDSMAVTKIQSTVAVPAKVMNFSDEIIEFTFTAGGDPKILSENMFQYLIKYGEDGDLSRVSPIRKIYVSMMNATNCWESVQLDYNTMNEPSIGMYPYLMIIGTPLYCDIPTKILGVELEFRFDGETDFSSLPIHENADGSAGFYNDKENY